MGFGSWNEDFDFFFPAGASVPAMELEMWDKDTAARDDFMGDPRLAQACAIPPISVERADGAAMYGFAVSSERAY
jgi:hypothetical protein